ncbi:hypothetical protein F52700_10768 [Fusarium sp. NRRL 52700]|nr:hypothetical protein F52700_10768 [Fusarium sp. NRRL 52700]
MDDAGSAVPQIEECIGESRALRKERRERKLWRRSGFLCTLASADYRDEQLKGASQPIECAQRAQLNCYPDGLPMETREDKHGNIQRTNDCSCSDQEMTGLRLAPRILAAPQQRPDNTNGETSTSIVEHSTQRIETRGSIPGEHSAQEGAPTYLLMSRNPRPKAPVTTRKYKILAATTLRDKLDRNLRFSKVLPFLNLRETGGELGHLQKCSNILSPRENPWRMQFKNHPQWILKTPWHHNTVLTGTGCVWRTVSVMGKNTYQSRGNPPRPMSPFKGHLQDQLDTIEMSVAVEALEHQPDSTWQGPNPSRNNDLPDVVLQNDQLQITTYPEDRNFDEFVPQESDTEHHCSEDTSLPSAALEDAGKHENEEATTGTTTMLQIPTLKSKLRCLQPRDASRQS